VARGNAFHAFSGCAATGRAGYAEEMEMNFALTIL
jgi:hypothetical protein